MGSLIVDIKHLKKSFGTNEVLKDINLNIKKGENLVVLGKSGSGKSVLIKCLVGLIEPDEGEVSLFDQDISELRGEELNQLRKRIGFLFQSAALYDSMSVRENLAFPLRDSKDLSEDEIEALVVEALKMLVLKTPLKKCPLSFRAV